MKPKERERIYAYIRKSLDESMTMLTRVQLYFDKKYEGDMPPGISFEYDLVYGLLSDLEDIYLDLNIEAEEEDD